MQTLNRWERAIERWEASLLAKMARSEPVELLDALKRECDSHAVVCGPTRVVVPNVYDVELADAVHEELTRRGCRVGQVLTDRLMRHAEDKGYEWAGPLAVRVSRSDRVPNGRYRVVGRPMRHIRADAFTDAAA
ncbi:hypothetical protein TPA0910_06930 [Streptomyces hygroscopicus subsp. sporocinereus]|uniref:FhaA N-terminal domain-containing protein n=1 Tax=Streptomyces hygroscopicus TaxID=1912 RepID=A0ABQ3TSG6_STRHY|nr:DUF3662 domain-containing protein [Streptomyces hygroscopicus]GHJ26260.1 hypothetical protein TPA0910_06930 [Streptomyces hygroscopicus]